MDYGKIESWEYLDKVGLMHTGAAGFAHRYVKFRLLSLIPHECGGNGIWGIRGSSLEVALRKLIGGGEKLVFRANVGRIVG